MEILEVREKRKKLGTWTVLKKIIFQVLNVRNYVYERLYLWEFKKFTKILQSYPQSILILIILNLLLISK